MLKKVVATLGVLSMVAVAGCSSSGDKSNGEGGSGGVKTGPGVSSSEINVGILTDYSGPIAAAATAGSVGMEVYFDKVNDAGGVCDRKIVAVKGDTKYDAQLTAQAYRGMENKIVMLGQVVGTAGLMAIKDSIERTHMATISSSLNSIVMSLPDIYVTLPLFEIELINGLVWAAKEAGASSSKTVKVSMVTPVDDFGKRYAEALKFAAEKTPGVKIAASVTYAPTDTDFTAQVSKLKEADADIVMLGTDPGKTASLVGQSAQLGYKPTWVSSSGAWTAGIAAPLKGLLDKYFVSGGYGTLADDNPDISALKAAVAKYAPNQKADNFLVGGWLEAQTVVAALKKACTNKDLTREGIVNALKDLKVDYDGAMANINIGNGKEPVSYATRINRIGDGGATVAVTGFEPSDVAKSWAKAQGF